MDTCHEEAEAMITDDADREQALRAKAVRQLKKQQRDFRSHVLLYVLAPSHHAVS
jgi:septin family protein